MVTILTGDCRELLKTLPDASVNCCVTSPPYWRLRDYGVDGQIGLERTPEEYIVKMVEVFREVRRVLRDDATLWLNLGDSYFASGQGYGDTKTTNKNHDGSRERQKPIWTNCGLKPKDLVGIPWRVAFALQADGWYLRQDIIWSKPNPMPESVTDRCTKAHEYIFLLSKSTKYYYDAEAIKEPSACENRNGFRGENDGPTHYANQPTVPNNSERFTPKSWNGSKFEDGKNLEVHPNVGKKRKPAGWDTAAGSHGTIHRDGRAKTVEYTDGISETRNKRSVWTVATQPFKDAHFATFPPKLITPCILAGCPEGGTVLDPFGGSGTVGEVSESSGRNSILIELNQKYCEMASHRTAQQGLFFK